MGGKALKSIETVRLQANEYHALVPLVLKEIANAIGGDRDICEIEAYRSKPDFGDMDVLVVSDEIPSSYKDDISKVFASREVYKNSNVTSFDRSGFQVDVIAIPRESFAYAKAYFSFNDLGNLVGRIAHKMGLKHGFDGLWLPLRSGTNMYAEIPVTKDMDKALSFLGYSPKRMKEGFNDLEEIFRFVASTPYFNPDIYLLENRNATSRVRDSKRKTYMEFLKWVDSPSGLTEFNRRRGFNGEYYQFTEPKSIWIDRVRSSFPEVCPLIDEANDRLKNSETAKLKFNGELVRSITGLEGKELGELIRDIKIRHSSEGDSFTTWVLSASPADIECEIRGVFNQGSLESTSLYGKVSGSSARETLKMFIERG